MPSSYSPYIIIGFDPGKLGAICILPRKYKEVRTYEFKNYSLRQLASILEDCTSESSYDIFVEKSGLHPTNGKQSFYQSGRNFGQIEGLLAKYPYTVIGSTRWMNLLDCRTGGDKNVTKDFAESIFGKYIRVTHINADALLIAHYGHLIYGKESRS